MAKQDIYIYADWKELKEPIFMGTLSALFAKGKKVFSFEYDKNWLKSNQRIIIDPDIEFYAGNQYPSEPKDNFGIF